MTAPTKTKTKTPTQADMELERPNSLRDFLKEELANDNAYRVRHGKEPEQHTDKDIDELMSQLYAWIEKEALRRYSSNAPWAIKEFIVKNILQEEVVNEYNFQVASEISQPVEVWQNDPENFDPLQHFRLKLETSRKRPEYIKGVMVPARWFVRDYGRKRRYTESEILHFLRALADKYTKKDDKGKVVVRGIDTASYVTRVTQFKRFLDSLPEDQVTGRKQTIPFELPSFPDEFNQPMFSNEDIDLIIYKAITEEKPVVALRIALATIYGCRSGEIASMDSSRINLDDMTISVQTEKRGVRKPQPFPETLKPLFSVPLQKTTDYQVVRELKRVCRKARVDCPKGTGMHAVRRAVASALFDEKCNLKELTIRRFLRWSVSRVMGAFPRYVKTPVETTDLDVLEVHPYVKIWKELLPFIEYLPKWSEVISPVCFIKNITRPATKRIKGIST